MRESSTTRPASGAASPASAGSRRSRCRSWSAFDNWADRSGTTVTQVLPDTTAATIEAHLATAIEPDALLVTDAAPFFPPCARALGLTHAPLDRKAGERRRGDLHSNTKGSRHERLETFRHGRRGVATRYLGSYLAWYHLAILPKLPTPRSVLAAVAGLTPVGKPLCMANAN